MSVIYSIALRNLVRQKRRNILLGIAIAFGAGVLILANAFSHGISEVLFNHVVKYANGHVSLSYMRNGNMMTQVFYDDKRIQEAIKKAAPEATLVQESIGIFGRAVGNGVADFVILVGVDMRISMTKADQEEYAANFKMLSGSFESLKDSTVSNPVLVSEQKAKYLKLKVGDALRVRFTGVTNQAVSAQLTVIGIFKPANAFMSSPVFLELKDLRRISGYGPHDIAAMQVNVAHPQKDAKRIADALHTILRPGLGVMPGTIIGRNGSAPAITLGFRTDSASRSVMSKGLRLHAGDSARAVGNEGVIVSYAAAKNLDAAVGDTVRFSWEGKFDTTTIELPYTITAVADSSAPLPPGVTLLLNEKDFYRAYYMQLPVMPPSAVMKTMPDSTHPLAAALAPEYMLMKRCKSTQEVTKIIREMGRARYKGIMVSVQSMYETASAILNVEFALYLITFIASMVLFVIILIGVINTLRMTIRERTREIGTVRAIGMQRKDVQATFILETGYLALFSSVAGAAGAFLAMWGLSSLTINAGDNPLGMLLIKNHLYFAPTAGWTLGYIAFIVIIALVTAYFPARRASNLSAANAMRHYE